MERLGTKMWRFTATQRRPFLVGVAVFTTLMGIFAYGFLMPSNTSTPAVVPQYNKEGALLRPQNFYNWVFVGSSIGLSYAKNGNHAGPGMFHNVYTQPQAYQEFLRTGKFPEKTMFVLAIYDSAPEVSIAKHGYIESELADLDVSVKDHQHFPEGWAYFNFSGAGGKFAATAKAFPKTECFSCHAQHAASDNVFTQFYPVLRQAHSQK